MLDDDDGDGSGGDAAKLAELSSGLCVCDIQLVSQQWNCVKVVTEVEVMSPSPPNICRAV